jgi:glycogen synthase
MYPPHHLGGYELVWQGAVHALRQAGHRVRVLTTDFQLNGAKLADEDDEVYRDLRWYWRDHKFPRLSGKARAKLEVDNAETLARQLREWRPHAVAWWAMGGMSLSMIEQVSRAHIPSAGFVHDDWLIYGPKVDQWLKASGRSERASERAERKVGIPTRVDFRGVDRWVFVSDTTRKRAIAAVGELGDTEVAPSGIDPAFVDPVPPHDWAWRLLHVGRLDPRKGVDTAVESLRHLPPQATLVLAGGGDAAYERRLRGRIRELRLGERVHLLGGVPRSRLMQLYAEADAVLFPVTWEEPWGLVPLEAMGRGVPVVATGRGGSGEYLRDGDNAMLFQAGDAEGLASALRRIADSPSLRARLRDGGLATAEHHTAPKFEARVIEVLREISS